MRCDLIFRCCGPRLACRPRPDAGRETATIFISIVSRAAMTRVAVHPVACAALTPRSRRSCSFRRGASQTVLLRGMYQLSPSVRYLTPDHPALDTQSALLRFALRRLARRPSEGCARLRLPLPRISQPQAAPGRSGGRSFRRTSTSGRAVERSGPRVLATPCPLCLVTLASPSLLRPSLLLRLCLCLQLACLASSASPPPPLPLPALPRLVAPLAPHLSELASST